MAVTNAAKWAAAAGLVAVRVNRRHHPRIWSVPKPQEAAVALSAGAAALVLSGALHQVFHIDVADEGTVTVATQSNATRWSMVLTAAITEEVINRGFEVESLISVAGAPVAGILNVAHFAAGHVRFFGLKTVLVRLPATASLAAVYLWRRNLPLVMLTHFVLDAPLLFSGFRRQVLEGGDRPS